MMSYHSEVNVPIFMVFFNRPDPLKQVFEAVRKVRPAKLFLCQDGPRAGNSKDLENIAKCREIVSEIDWDCEATYDYSETNLGCGMRIYSGITNAFQKVDRLIILEDDTVPCQSFFPFCEEVLERYKDDPRMKIISGMNHLGVYEGTDDDYFFTASGSIWGWATWKRAWDQVEYDMPYLNDQKVLDAFYSSLDNKRKARQLLADGRHCKAILESGGKLSAWSYQHGIAGLLNNQLNIVPKYNLTSNIGLTDDSTHGGSELRKTPKGLQCVFYAKTYEMTFPLKHPKYVINDKYFEKQVDKIMGWTFWRGKVYRLESISRQIVFAKKGDYRNLWRKLLKKLGLKK